MKQARAVFLQAPLDSACPQEKRGSCTDVAGITLIQKEPVESRFVFKPFSEKISVSEGGINDF